MTPPRDTSADDARDAGDPISDPGTDPARTEGPVRRIDQAASDALDGYVPAPSESSEELAGLPAEAVQSRVAEFDALRRLMVDEDVGDRPGARRARIDVALAAASRSEPSGSDDTDELARRRAASSTPRGRSLLVAAAVVAVAGFAALGLNALGGSGEMTASGGDAATASPEPSDASQADRSEAPESFDGSSDEAPLAPNASPTTVAATGEAGADGRVGGIVLGDFDSLDAVLRAAGEAPAPGDVADDGGSELPSCGGRIAELGARTLGTASVRGTPVIVIVVEPATQTVVLDSVSCTELARGPLR